MLNLFSSRRSHLDSSSYRTLVRIFSLCLDLDDDSSLNPSQLPIPNSNPNPTFDAEEFGPRATDKGLPFADSPQDDASPNFDSASNADGGSEKGVAFANPNLGSYDLVKDLEFDDECAPDMALLEGLMSDCAELLDGRHQDDTLGLIRLDDLEAKINQENRESSIGNSGKGTDLEKEARKGTGQEITDIINSEVSKSTALRQNNSDQLKYEDERNGENNSDQLKYEDERNGEAVEDMALDKSTTVDQMRKIGEGTQQEKCTEFFRERNLDDCADFEEGEIPNDFKNSDQSLDLMHEPARHIEEGSVSEGFDKNENSISNLFDGHSNPEENICNSSFTTLICAGNNQGIEAVGLKPEKMKSYSDAAKSDVMCNAADPDTLQLPRENLKSLAKTAKRKPSENEVVEVQVKRKYAPLTQERKAKKKIAKKRKRAQKEREQGVKRLKLQPIVKPKEVKYCNFYLKGRCQQGDSCKFSHDTTPLTKSQPCKYFACDSCLKGDDCPFDHELSKYPCHNYMSRGTCIRGDTCKFSHKLQVTEASSPASVVSKADSPWSSGKSNSVKQFRMNRTSLGGIDQPKSSAPSSSQPTVHKPLAGNLVNVRKEPPEIPNGIRFLQFGNTDKQNGNQQKQGKKLLAAGSSQTSLEKNMLPCTAVYKAAATTNAYKKSNDRSLQTEVSASEASKLLDEFLFCVSS